MRCSGNDEWLIKRRGSGGGRDGDECVESYSKTVRKKNRKKGEKGGKGCLERGG